MNRLIKLDLNEIEKVLMECFRIGREEIHNSKYGNVSRKLFMYALKKYTSMDLREIGKIFGIKSKSVSSTVINFERNGEKDEKIRAMPGTLDSKIEEIHQLQDI